MKILNFRVFGFKAKNRHANVNFSNSNVTVIYGDNGCGKTTFLKILGAFLAQDDSALALMGVDAIACTILEENVYREIYVHRIGEGSYDWSDFENSWLASSRSLSLGVDRGISTLAMKIDTEALAEFFMHFRQSPLLTNETPMTPARRRQAADLAEEVSSFLRRRAAHKSRTSFRRSEIEYEKPHLYLQSIKIENIEELLTRRYRIARHAATKKIQSALFDTLSIAIDTGQNQSSKYLGITSDYPYRLLENRARIIEALDDGEANAFKERIINILQSIDTTEGMQRVIEHDLLRQLFRNMMEELEVERLMLSSINLVIDTFNGYLIENKKLVISGDDVYIDIGGDVHSLNDLSSGERHILTFLALVLFEGEGRNFLIIDEPEISLNIKWQRELMSLFSELLPETQIIVASHSPALAKRNPDFLSELLVWRSKNDAV